MSRFQLFWTWFLSRSEYINKHLESDTENIALEIKEHLKEVHEDIEFEIPFEYTGKNRPFIISADGDIELFDLVIALCKSAPIIPNWEIVSFRPRLNQRNQIIDLDGISMDYNDIFFQCEEIDNQLILDVYIKNYDGTDNRYIHLYFLLLDSLIGEYDSVTLIKETRIHPFNDRIEKLGFPLLLKIINNLKDRLKGS